MTLSIMAALSKDQSTGLAPLQHRHFATIAAIICDMGDMDLSTDEVARFFAARLPATNPKFDADRFLAACGVSE